MNEMYERTCFPSYFMEYSTVFHKEGTLLGFGVKDRILLKNFTSPVGCTSVVMPKIR